MEDYLENSEEKRKKYISEDSSILSCGSGHQNVNDMYKCRSALPYVENAKIEIKKELLPHIRYYALFNEENVYIDVFDHVFDLYGETNMDEIPLFRMLCVWNVAGLGGVSPKIIDHHACKTLNKLNCIITSEAKPNSISFVDFFESRNDTINDAYDPTKYIQLFAFLALGCVKTEYLTSDLSIVKGKWEISDIEILLERDNVKDILFRNYDEDYSLFIKEDEIKTTVYGEKTIYTKNLDPKLKQIEAYNMLHNTMFFLETIKDYTYTINVNNFYTNRFAIVVARLIDLLIASRRVKIIKKFESLSSFVITAMVYMIKDLFPREMILSCLEINHLLKDKYYRNENDYYFTREKYMLRYFKKILFPNDPTRGNKDYYSSLLNMDVTLLDLGYLSNYGYNYKTTDYRKCPRKKLEELYEGSARNYVKILRQRYIGETMEEYYGYFNLIDNGATRYVDIVVRKQDDTNKINLDDEFCIIQLASENHVYPYIYDIYYMQPWMGKHCLVTIAETVNFDYYDIFHLLGEVILLDRSGGKDIKIYQKFILLVCHIISCYILMIKLTYLCHAVIEEKDLNLEIFYISDCFVLENFSETDNPIYQNLTKAYVINYENFKLFSDEEIKEKYTTNQYSFLNKILEILEPLESGSHKSIQFLLREFIHFLKDGVPETPKIFTASSDNIRTYALHLYKCVDEILLKLSFNKDPEKLYKITQLFRDTFV